MSCVIYNRVSSLGQNVYNKSISLAAQEHICSKFAHDNKLKVKSIHKEVHTAFKKCPVILAEVVHKKNQNIIISAIDRFSRNSVVGDNLARISIRNKNKLIFVQEKFVCENTSHLDILKKYLCITEQESTTTSGRIKNARTYLINNGMFAGGYVPYGYNVVDKKLVHNTYEQNIIKFIRECLKSDIRYSTINDCMQRITKSEIPIKCYDKKNNEVLCITESLNYTEISDILNDYGVKKRGITWKPSLIKTAIKPYDPKVELGGTKLVDFNDFSNELNNIFDEIKSIPNAFNFEAKECKAQEREVKCNISSRYNTVRRNNIRDNMDTIRDDMRDNTKKRRSKRLNPDLEEDSDDDVELVKQFKQFIKFKKFKKLMRD